MEETLHEAQPKRHVPVAYLVMVSVAMVVGAGIFKSPAWVAAGTGSLEWLLAAWAFGGLITFIGALCYSELATAYPSAGGDYHFISLAFGKVAGFLFSWTRFTVINTGQIAVLGYTLGDYLNPVFSLGENGSLIWAVAAIVAMTLWNLKGLFVNAATDYGLTGLEVAGVAVIVVAGLFIAASGIPPATVDPVAAPAPASGAFFQAMVYVMLAFGGWAEIATLSAEVKDGKRGMVRAHTWSIVTITCLYLAVNWALWRGLGIEGLASSEAPAADLMQVAFGPAASIALALAVSLATLTSINATIIVGSRTTYAAAHDWPQLKALGTWDEGKGIPARAILAQSGVALLLVAWGASTRNGFESLVNFTAPVYWLFMVASGASLIVLRLKRPNAERPWKVPLYPLIPLLFIASSLAMVWSSVEYVHYLWSEPANRFGAIGNVGLFAAGLALALWLRASTAPKSSEGRPT